MTNDSATQDEIRGRRLEKLRFWRRACADESAILKPYNIDATGNPLIFLHGDFDMGGFYVRRLAAECNYPIAAIAPQGLHDNDLRASIEWMARERLKDILAFRPSGPYRLGGYCNGALVAYECARLLKEKGHEVELVIMIEPSSLNARPFYRRLHSVISSCLAFPEKRTTPVQRRFGDAMYMAWNLGRVAHLSPGELVRLARYLAQQRATRRKRLAEQTEAMAGERKIMEKNAYLRRFYTAASASYLPQPTTAPVIVLSTGLDGGGRKCGLYDGTQWSRLASNFRHIQLPGHHSTCLSVHASELAANLSSVLDGPLPGRAQMAFASRKPRPSAIPEQGGLH